MSGVQHRFQGVPDKDDPVHAQVAARILECAAQCAPTSHAPTADAALSELLRGRSLYSDKPSDTSLAPFGSGTVSLPETVEDAPTLASLLPEECLAYLKGGH